MLAAASHPGLRRAENQDAFWVYAVGRLLCAAVLDGVSGSQSPSVAAGRAAAGFAAGFLEGGGTSLREGLARAQKAASDIDFDPGSPIPPPGAAAAMFTVSPLPAGGVRVEWAWIGDVRIWYVPQGFGPSVPLTRDHEEGGVLLRCLGRDADDQFDSGSAAFPRAGWVVCCTDGLWRYDPGAAVMAALLRSGSGNPAEAVRTFLGMALEAGGADNVTVAVAAV